MPSQSVWSDPLIIITTNSFLWKSSNDLWGQIMEIQSFIHSGVEFNNSIQTCENPGSCSLDVIFQNISTKHPSKTQEGWRKPNKVFKGFCHINFYLVIFEAKHLTPRHTSYSKQYWLKLYEHPGITLENRQYITPPLETEMGNSIREKSTKHNDAVTVITGGMMLTDQAVGLVWERRWRVL